MAITIDLYPTPNQNVIGNSTIKIRVIGMSYPAGTRRDSAAPFVSEKNLKNRMNTGLQGSPYVFLFPERPAALAVASS